ncbi:MAG TPA: hypothetical protein VF300_01860 [Methanothrix sp.]
MSSAKYTAMVLAVMFIALAYCASAQWSPGGNMVYMGDLNLAASSASSGAASHALGGPMASQMNLNNSSMNATFMNNTTIATPSGLKPLDLSNYAKDRVNNNLTGYKNIMYPISGSRGTTTSTSGGGGGGGCGCG